MFHHIILQEMQSGDEVREVRADQNRRACPGLWQHELQQMLYVCGLSICPCHAPLLPMHENHPAADGRIKTARSSWGHASVDQNFKSVDPAHVYLSSEIYIKKTLSVAGNY